MMKVAVLGASGRAGSAITKELVDRGHEVIGIARNPDRIAQGQGITAVAGDVNSPDKIIANIQGADAMVSAVHFDGSNPDTLIQLAKDAGVPRYLVVGGAGSLQAGNGQRVVETADFPEAYKPEAQAGVQFLERLQQEQDLDWSFLSPSAEFDGNERTGQFRLGNDQLLVADNGQSRISFPDYAVAFVDELENPAHSRRRFTVGY